MGLTWIDYETIDKPIEEITQGTGEADEIQFHVETLSNVKEMGSHGEGKYYSGSNNLGKPSKKDSLGGIKVRNVKIFSILNLNLIILFETHLCNIPHVSYNFIL